VLTQIFRPQSNGIPGDCRRLHNEELQSLYYACDHIKKNETGGTCGTYGDEERCMRGFGGVSRERTTWKT